jgi:hypothetical protein
MLDTDMEAGLRNVSMLRTSLALRSSSRCDRCQGTPRQSRILGGQHAQAGAQFGLGFGSGGCARR